ncbi:MAG: nucleotidyltransferase family protein, partial [Candidatus Dormiibacterota bacterium]
REDEADTLLRSLRPDVPWEAKNQAAVHTWYAARFGGAPYPPARSIEEAIGSWPETATAVVVRMEEDGRLAICAPLGLSDLLEGVWRRNPSQVTVEQSRDRLARHRISERWPRVRVIPPDA